MTNDEQRAYSRGYKAGKRRLAHEDDAAIIRRRREQFRQQAALAALRAIMVPGMNWGRNVDGKHVKFNTGSEFAKAAFSLADALLEHTYFDSGPFDLPATEEAKP